MIRFVLPEPTPSQNKTLRKHWGARKKIAERWATLLAVAGAARAPGATGRRRMTIERHCTGTLDNGNFIGGCKELIDELVKFGLLVDDKPKYLEDHYLQVLIRRPQKPFTVITLEDIDQ